MTMVYYGFWRVQAVLSVYIYLLHGDQVECWYHLGQPQLWKCADVLVQNFGRGNKIMMINSLFML